MESAGIFSSWMDLINNTSTKLWVFRGFNDNYFVMDQVQQISIQSELVLLD